MISVTNLEKYYGIVHALKGITFEVKKGEILGFLGPNGAGKTTAMKILTCYMPATRGQVYIDGLDINEYPLEIRQRIGYLPESTPLYTDITVKEFLEYITQIRAIPRSKRPSKIKDIVGFCGLKSVYGKYIGELSKGYRQRVGLAQAMIHDPPILILDEPTSGLDPNQIVEIREIIKEIGKERTVILSTHNLPEVQATCDRVLIIDKGKRVAHGTAEELRRKGEKVPRVKIKIGWAGGVTEEDIFRKKLLEQPFVTTVTPGEKELNGIHGFMVEGSGGGDIRRSLFELAVKENWIIYEMQLDILDLEGIFRSLTQE